ncbi:peptide chain release factor 1 [Opitutales bacterium]|nr:peptide chain release factor 1 [Opitutales bacterium]MDC1004116.1 peptide chain release factor 1 [Opitutales bacterium]
MVWSMVDLPNIEPFLQRYNELESKLADPSVFKDQELATKISREHSKIKVILEQFEEISICQKAIEDAKELINEPEFAETAKEEIEKLEIKIPSLHKTLLYSMLPEDPDLGRNTIIEIRAGAGGGEASLFASDLYRMYCKLAENKNWNFECMSQSTSETGGFKEVIFLLKGQDVWSKLKFESGVHRVQRVPVTEASGRIHTSTATVAVLPEARDVEIKIDPSELEINVCRASGPGGQGVNTTDSAVQILHKPTGLTVYCADERSQLKNKNKGMTVLKSRLLNLKQTEEREKYAKERRDQVGTGDRSERIRTYNFPQSRITDHRINYTSHALNEALLGDLDHLFDALSQEDQKIKLENMLSENE